MSAPNTDLKRRSANGRNKEHNPPRCLQRIHRGREGGYEGVDQATKGEWQQGRGRSRLPGEDRRDAAVRSQNRPTAPQTHRLERTPACTKDLVRDARIR